jgi:ATP-dependent helicase Lhr and Lhr-like helicase
MSSPPSGSSSESSSFELLDRRVQRWVYRNEWSELHDIQEHSIPPVLERQSDLIVAASTAAGKTEAAFLPITSSLCSDPVEVGLGALYISPLKALINDQHQRLELLCDGTGLELNSWHGDIGATAKRRVREEPGGILLITPESVESIFVNYGTSAPRIFGALRYVVIDELHAFIGTERGRQLQSLLHRIELAGRAAPMRIGLSATLGELSVAAEFMRPGAGEGVRIIESHGNPRDLKVQLRGYMGIEPNRESLEDAVDADREQIAAHIYKHMRGQDNLVFANSRASVEEFADLLRKKSEDGRVPVEFFPHHGNLSKGLREEVEELLRNPHRPTTAICTSTLELGIDVGSVTSVGQIDPPFSAAALRQRLGRSGRKPGDPSILRMYVSESPLEPGASPHEELREGLVQSIALIEALAEGWFEPPLDGALHLSTLIQQILSVIAQHGGAQAAQIWTGLCGSGPFDLDRDGFVKLLRCLVDREVIDQTGDGDLHLAQMGEKIVNHYSFFSAFETAEEYRLVNDGREIGSMPVYSPLTDESFLIFGGRRWKVVGVDDERRVITVVRAMGGKVPRFSGGGGLIHDEIRRRMREIYESDREPLFLDGTARQLLAEGRAAFRGLGLDQHQIVTYGSGSSYFSWRGDRVISTLVLGVRSAGRHVESEGQALLAPHCTPEELQEALTIAFGEGANPDPIELMGSVKNLETEKHHWLLHPDLLLMDAAIGRLDVPGAVETVSQLGTGSRAAESASPNEARSGPEFVVVDCETTGLHPSAQHRIVELAMLVLDIDGSIIDRWSSLLQPDRDLGSSEIHGIRSRELSEAPRFADIAGEVSDRLAGRVLVAHNARFDKAFLESELKRAGVEGPALPYICTMELASRLGIGGARRRLADCRADLSLPHPSVHQALADAETSADLLSRYLARYGEATLGLTKGKVHPVESWPEVSGHAASIQRQPAFAEHSERSNLAQLLATMSLPAGHEDADTSAYLEALERAIEDRHLHPEEQEELLQTAEMLGIATQQLAELNHAYVEQLIELAWRDGAVTEREREDLYLVSRALGVGNVAERLRGAPATSPPTDPPPTDTKQALRGKSVCFTGELTCKFEGERMTRERASLLAAEAGLVVLPRVTKKLDLLVLTDPHSTSGKARKAREYGTRLIAETAFWAMIGIEVR